jgi:hypothetical protein
VDLRDETILMILKTDDVHKPLKIALGLKASGYPFIWVIHASNSNG